MAYSPSFAMVVDAAWVQGHTRPEIRQEDRRGIGQVQKQGFSYSARLVN